MYGGRPAVKGHPVQAIYEKFNNLGYVRLKLYEENEQENLYRMYDSKARYLGVAKYEHNNRRWSDNDGELTIATGSKYLHQCGSPVVSWSGMGTITS